MRPARIARIALVALAALAGVVAFGVWAGRPADPPIRPMHEQYRVELEVPPVEAALWFVAHYPQYFTSGDAGLEPWLAGLEPGQREFVLAMGQTLTWAWIEHELDGFGQANPYRDPVELARKATFVIRHKTLNQLDLNLGQYPDVAAIEFSTNVGDPEFAAGAFARLVRGVDNCEGQNHQFAVLLATAFESRALGWPEIDVVLLAIRPGHELVKLSGPTLGQAVYVDAWSNLPAFTLDPSRPRVAHLLGDFGGVLPPVVPRVAGGTAFSAEVYAAGHEDALRVVSDRRSPTRPVDLDVRAPALDEEDPWKLYLFARILHLYDDPRAADLYRRVIERTCSDPRRGRVAFVCAASTALLDRIEWPR